ncbi:MAG: sugar transferase [Clostridia bacterium]|nr:sugar transferase [Clostridia bacterium]
MIILLSPLLLIISLAVLIADGRPVIFKQCRVGRNNKLFYIYKFRTMKNGIGDIATKDFKDFEASITFTGRFLRKTSLDELPQLINIIKGEMSFVGPRPLIPDEKEIRKLREEYNVFSVRPGLTGLAQVNGRDALTDIEKAAFDREYVENRSFSLDIKILFRTFFAVLFRKDIIEGSEKFNKR